MQGTRDRGKIEGRNFKKKVSLSITRIVVFWGLCWGRLGAPFYANPKILHNLEYLLPWA